ncbi:helix-turn-helix transcriptional regulator [Saccharopolyspora sp. TS4A08]|uniref:Helix-turn-helix transcriptional regulator n=1 Tax=Saccharopolyspora ipomoeae TaxID=3042027 RepID=A0ABT6PTZ4_9PSEU|nr:helix-turn-helix transcriptional regulator [Saccharopolyspora sp. TS4A08]MDI2031480.1 helix-turn-helix transcriptional regulator [Saccharopolyspora sp. TS4A08]
MTLGPTARRRRLGAHLAELRHAAGLTTADVAEFFGCTAQTIRNWERGTSTMKKVELAALLDKYGAAADTRSQLEETRREGSKRGWWSTYKLPEWFKPYVGLETDAAMVCNFEVELIPGLLQTESYAREIHSSGGLTKPDEVDKRVSARLARQRRLTEESPLELRVVISEGALRRRVGGPEVMQEQLDQLIKHAQLPNVIFQVLPFNAGAHASMPSGFTLLTFAEQTDPDVGYLEGPLGGHVIEDVDDVTTLHNRFDRVRSAALPERESLSLVRTIARE